MGLEGTARPAEPLLASSLVADGELEVLFERVVGAVKGGRRRDGGERLETGVRSLDEALGGGLEVGRVVGVSCEAGGGMGDVSTVIAWPCFSHVLLEHREACSMLMSYSYVLPS